MASTQTQNRPLGWGADVQPENRPGVPQETEPSPLAGAHWQSPDRQKAVPPLHMRAELDEPTPVWGTAQPPHGLSGLLRKSAYAIPDHRPSHWLLLMSADRVDVMESRVADLVKRRPIVVGATLTAAALALFACGRSTFKRR
jgi:hypothetical protein